MRALQIIVLVCINKISCIGYNYERECSSMSRKSFINIKHPYEIFHQRPKRFVMFEKGAALTVQTNVGKSILSQIPRGLNQIFEYTLMYELPSDEPEKIIKKQSTVEENSLVNAPYYKSHSKEAPTTMKQKDIPEKLKTLKCFNYNLYQYYNKEKSTHGIQKKKLCRKPQYAIRTKRLKRQLSIDGSAQRMLYDILVQWSVIHGFLPHYCFMRTLCEATHLLMPHGSSLLHDIIHILFRYSQPWIERHTAFAGSLRHHRDINECAEYYGPHCRVSWLHYITQAFHVDDNMRHVV